MAADRNPRPLAPARDGVERRLDLLIDGVRDLTDAIRQAFPAPAPGPESTPEGGEIELREPAKRGRRKKTGAANDVDV